MTEPQKQILHIKYRAPKSKREKMGSDLLQNLDFIIPTVHNFRKYDLSHWNGPNLEMKKLQGLIS